MVTITVEKSSESIGFAPEFSAQDKEGNMLLPLLDDAPLVFINNAVPTNVALQIKLRKVEQQVTLVNVDFWAGPRLTIQVIE